MITLITTDGKKLEMKEEHAFKSILLDNIFTTFNNIYNLEILLDFETLSFIYNFMQHDFHNLKKDYNFLEIHFSSEMLHYFDNVDNDKLLKICNAANYLNYPYLLELCCKIIANKLTELPDSNLEEFPFKLLGDRKFTKEDVDKIVNEEEWNI